MTLATKVEEFHQPLGARALRYRLATATLPDATAALRVEVGERAAHELVRGRPEPTPLQFALHLMSSPSARVPVSAMRDAVARTTAAAKRLQLSILGGHTLDIDAVLSCLMTIDLVADKGAGLEAPTLPAADGLPRRPCMGYAQVHGCGAKLPPDRLAELLPEMIVSGGTAGQSLLCSDDAVVVALPGGEALGATVDVITPVTQDPESYGAIAVAGALSDLYAKGITPVGAVALLGTPPRLDAATRAWVLCGAAHKLAEAGATLAGLHEIPSGELFFGLFAVGIGPARRTRPKAAVRCGDRLVLTKPLGTGILSTVEKRTGLTSEPALRDALRTTMEALNGPAAAALDLDGVSAATDVTGFSLVGHLLEMLQGHDDLAARLWAAEVPLIGGEELLSHLDSGMSFCSMTRNKHFLEPAVRVTGRGDARKVEVLYDAQTSGGLLLSVTAAALPACLETLQRAGVTAAVVGEIVPRDGAFSIDVDLDLAPHRS